MEGIKSIIDKLYATNHMIRLEHHPFPNKQVYMQKDRKQAYVVVDWNEQAYMVTKTLPVEKAYE